ncbi:helix-turn-helix transcriptional regulator [Galbitalea sp. SE-J8]|uniref:helix-turn-helix transcriptional regulator n=1 Tax=Galbitalea sp. SE-J8 TaxID=3054952 RepID=UPI00259CF712|nr:helix-turn-helix transcriptional regulator [Galbitalea sp. SE-J8]MDM4763368.1 helix-turn-helix transcriptional regulator [Galbitalea sp. SE-J8]
MSTAETAARELGEFLRSRRERTRPEDLGLEPGPRRRVDGLRREEVAVLAGLSTDYYQRLEQGRGAKPSDALLDSLSEALRLDAAEHRHVMTLARAVRQPETPKRRKQDRVPENAKRMLQAMGLPAFVLSRHLDLLAWNDSAVDLLGDPLELPQGRRNMLHVLFHDDDSRLRCAGWETMALDYIGLFRSAIGHDPGDPRAVTIVGELSLHSGEFRRLWARNEVRDNLHGSKTIRHPRIGEIAVEWDAYPLRGVPGPMMIVFVPSSV